MGQRPGGGGLEYKKGGGVRRLAWGCKFKILVSLRVSRKNHQMNIFRLQCLA